MFLLFYIKLETNGTSFHSLKDLLMVIERMFLDYRENTMYYGVNLKNPYTYNRVSIEYLNI